MEIIQEYCALFGEDVAALASLYEKGILSLELLEKKVKAHRAETRQRAFEADIAVQNEKIRSADKFSDRIETEGLFEGSAKFAFGHQDGKLVTKQPKVIKTNIEQHMLVAVRVQVDRFKFGSKGLWVTGAPTLGVTDSLIIGDRPEFKFDGTWASEARIHRVNLEIMRYVFWGCDELEDIFMDVREDVLDKSKAPKRVFKGFVLDTRVGKKTADFAGRDSFEIKADGLYLWEVDTRSLVERAITGKTGPKKIFDMAKKGDTVSANAAAMRAFMRGEMTNDQLIHLSKIAPINARKGAESVDSEPEILQQLGL